VSIYKLVVLLIVLITGYSFCYECPPLKWAKHADEINVVPDVIMDLSDTSILCSGTENVIIDKRDGSVIGTKPGLIIKDNSRTHEGGFISLGRRKMTVVNNRLEELWSKEFDLLSLKSVIQTRDSGYAALGVINEYEEFQIIIMDKKGSILKKNQIDGNTYYENGVLFKGIIEVDNGIVVYGTGMSVWPEALVSKYSFDGIEIWSKIFGGTGISEMIAVENGIAFTGCVDPEFWKIVDTVPSRSGLGKRLYSPDSYVPLIYLNSDGSIILNKSFDTMQFDDCRSIRKCGDMFFLAYYTCDLSAGETESQTIVAVNESGENVWSKKFILDNHDKILIADMNPRVQPFSSGELLIFALDTLCYYAKSTGTKQEHNVNLRQSLNNILCKIDNNDIRYTLVEPSEVTLSLLTLHGKVIRLIDKGFKPAGGHRISLRGLPKGVYLVKLNSSEASAIQKIIISK